MDFVKRLTLLTLLLSLFALSGCASIGPGAVSRDRFDYTTAVAESWKSQMLLNLVKIRYGDAPVFLDVGQIVAGYSFNRSLGASGSANMWQGNPPVVFPTGTAGMTAGGTFNDSPTITYTPLAGERFARSLMMPIPPSAIMNVVQAGFPVEMVFRLAVQSINGIDNRSVKGLSVVPADPEFYDLLQNLRRIQTSGDIGMRLRPGGQEVLLQLIVRPKLTAAVENARFNVASILGLERSSQEYRIVYGVVPSDEKEIAILTRSIFEILKDLSTNITVPETDVTERRVSPTPEADLGPDGPIPPLIRIASSANHPDNAFVAVPYRGYWYSIDDQDMRSKHMFSFIMFLFTFVETGSKEAAPVLTIPTTR